ncbi:MAG: DUF3696 domain-containing protein [Deltaproteobacteria bacterium]|nr:DUF3696 domain-containing protein [Deltaproteobacteria bacterium]
MLVNQISLKNFKCFRQVDIDLSQITLLTGENSSGKSSLLYGLLAPFQSKEFPFYLSPNGKYVNMGDFKEISFKNSTENKIELDISVTPRADWKENYQTVWSVDATNRLPKFDYLRYTYEDFYQCEIKANDVYIVNCNVDEQLLEAYLRGKENTKIDVEGIRQRFIRYGNVKGLQFTSLDEIYGAMYKDKIQNISYALEEVDRDLNFIGPFRLEPERTYYQKTKADEKIGRSGEGYIDQILEWESQKAEEFGTLKSILKDLGLLRTLKVQPIRGGRFELNVKVQSNGIWTSLADVGFGISQFLPVVVADLQLSSNSSLLLAQPEIHLHPSVQASLADYFVKQSRETKKQYIIETHSEYLLNRIRLAIVKGEIEPSNVAVYYFENSVKGSVAHKIEFTKDGQILNAPQGFFDTYMVDTMDIALHA